MPGDFPRRTRCAALLLVAAWGSPPLARAGAQDGRPPPKAEQRPASLDAVAFTPDGNQLLAASRDGSLSLWDLGDASISLARLLVPPAGPAGADPGSRTIISFKNGYQALAFPPKGERFAVAGYARVIELRTLDPAQPPHVLAGHTGAVQSLAFSPDGKRLASAGEDRTVRVWDVGRKAPAEVLKGLKGPVRSVRWSSDGSMLAAADGELNVAVWDAETWGLKREFQGPPGEPKAKGASLAWAPDGGSVAVGYWSEGSENAGHIMVHYLKAPRDLVPPGREVGNVSRHLRLGKPGQGVMTAAFAPRGGGFVTLLYDRSVVVWDPAAWRVKAVEPLKKQFPATVFLSAAFSPDGRRLAIGAIRVRQVKDAKSGKSLPDPEGLVISIRWNDGEKKK